ncbi:MAG: hypothetical protein WDN31_06130 [Hyphomicrobium sp.]
MYKNVKGADGALEAEDFENGFDELSFAAALMDRLAQIPSGAAAATNYHSFMLGVLTFVFYPELICPVKERELHQGRKRVDIVFTNAAREGFFYRLLAAAQTRSTHIFVECKNYTYDIGNPELDQIGGRFGHQRGFFGFLLCRLDGRRDVTRERCRDTARDGRGYIVVLTDDDIREMLQLIGARQRSGISQYLQQRYDELVF